MCSHTKNLIEEYINPIVMRDTNPKVEMELYRKRKLHQETNENGMMQ